MTEQRTEVRRGVELAWDRFGDGGEPILLIMGLGSQMLLWNERFCQELVHRGHQVVRFDNRDVGGSTRFDHADTPSLRRVLAAGAIRAAVDVRAPYLLADMADDAAALMDHLGWAGAHVVGASMGGMIAQELALRHPSRVRSLVSIMSTPRPRIPGRRGIATLIRGPRGRDEQAYVDHMVRVFTSIGGPHIPPDEARLRETAHRCFARGLSPKGFVRQLAAIVASGDRRARLEQLDTPTLVIHGRQDPMVPLRAGRETAEIVPGARLLVLDDMGHDMGSGLWPRLHDAIAAHVHHAAPGQG